MDSNPVYLALSMPSTRQYQALCFHPCRLGNHGHQGNILTNRREDEGRRKIEETEMSPLLMENSLLSFKKATLLMLITNGFYKQKAVEKLRKLNIDDSQNSYHVRTR